MSAICIIGVVSSVSMAIMVLQDCMPIKCWICPDMPQAHKAGDGYKLSAGWLIDKAGWKGKTLGRAGVWPKQALVLYNTGSCTGAEVVALAQAILKDVQQQFGVALEPEAIIV